MTMKRWVFDPIIIAVAAAAFLLFLKMAGSLFQQDPTPMLEEAYSSYQSGESASDIAQRKQSFNKALELYSKLEDRYHPTMGNGKLYYNIANTFFQLEAYPWAILNDYRALALNPRDGRARDNLRRSQAKLNLPADEASTPFRPVIFFHTDLSIPERIQLFSALAALSFAAFSLYIWREGRLWRSAGIGLGLLAAVLLFSLGYSHYIAPIEGVLIRSTQLYRDAGKQYAPVSEEPTPSGLKLEVLDKADFNRWLKVRTPSGTVGFIPAETLRLI